MIGHIAGLLDPCFGSDEAGGLVILGEEVVERVDDIGELLGKFLNFHLSDPFKKLIYAVLEGTLI